jgi:sugar lactone lactonase YvrE
MILTASTQGATPFSYQWYRNGVMLPGANASTFRLEQVAGLNNQDAYTVRVSNSSNTSGVISNVAKLSVTSSKGIDLVAGCATFLTRAVSIDGKGNDAALSGLGWLTFDKTGNIFTVDNYGLRKITSDGNVSTVFPTMAGVQVPITMDGSGNIYYAQYPANRFAANTLGDIQKLAPGGSVSPIGWSDFVNGMVVDATGNVYVTDYGNSIHKISPSGVVTLVAGVSDQPGNVDGVGSAARFWGPRAMTIDGVGNLFVVDYGNAKIRKITPQGQVTTFATFVSTSTTAPDVVLVGQPEGGVVMGGAFGVARVASDGTKTSLIDNSSRAAGSVLIPAGIALDATGAVYVTDGYTVKRVAANGDVTTIAGRYVNDLNQACAGSMDGDPFTARFSAPAGLASDVSGNLFISDAANYTVRKITPAGSVSTVAGLAGVRDASNSTTPPDGQGSAARFNGGKGLATDGAGNVYVADAWAVRKITSAGVVSSITVPQDYWVNGLSSVAVDSIGNLYIVGSFGFTHPSADIIRRTTDGSFSFVNGLSGAVKVASDVSGQVVAVRAATCADYPFCTRYAVGKVNTDGSFLFYGQLPTPTTPGSPQSSPVGLASDSHGNIYVSVAESQSIYKITPLGAVTILAGRGLSNKPTGTWFGALPGSLYAPSALTVMHRGGVSKLIAVDSNAILSIDLEP